jgi:hypothetical protein
VAAFWAVLNVPEAQSVQVRLAVLVPAVATYCPALHVVHAVHAVAFSAELKVPDAQSEQTRLAVAEPAVATY